jgi:superfamily II helicase
VAARVNRAATSTIRALLRLRYMGGTLTCTLCRRERPVSLFTGRLKIVYDGREMVCRTCQAEWWRIRELEQKSNST